MERPCQLWEVHTSAWSLCVLGDAGRWADFSGDESSVRGEPAVGALTRAGTLHAPHRGTRLRALTQSVFLLNYHVPGVVPSTLWRSGEFKFITALGQHPCIAPSLKHRQVKLLAQDPSGCPWELGLNTGILAPGPGPYNPLVSAPLWFEPGS